MISRRKILLGGLLLTGGLLSSNVKKIAGAEESARDHQRKNKVASGDTFDVAIIGGGFAGMQAALTLGRACRKVVVFDAKTPRNNSDRPIHNFVSRDGVSQDRLLEEAKDQLKQYDVAVHYSKVVGTQKQGEMFSIATTDGLKVTSKRLLLATGVRDNLPNIEGLAALWGKSVHYCPYCSGWELRAKPLAVLGKGDIAAIAALSLTAWSEDIKLFSDGDSQISANRKADLKKLNIELHEEKILALEGKSSLEAIVLTGDIRVKREAIFLQPKEDHHSEFLISLGAKQTEWGVPVLDQKGQTTVHGLYVAGDASGKALQAIGAAADGAQAAFALNRSLILETLQSRGVALT